MKKFYALLFLTLLVVTFVAANPSFVTSESNQRTGIAINPAERPVLNERTDLNRDYAWYEYTEAVQYYFTSFTETATYFEMLDFGLNYPATIQQVEAWFYDPGEWDSSTFRFRIYDSDATTILYESGDLTATHYAAHAHTLSLPIVVNDNFYVSVVTDPASLNGSPYILGTGETNGHSYFGSQGDFTLWADREVLRAVYLEGTIPVNPVLDVSPSSYDFGYLTPGCTASKTFDISNVGGNILNVSAAPTVSGDAAFTVSAHSSTYPVDVPPSIAVAVDFTPDTLGEFNAILTVVSDYGTVDVPLSGTGDAPDAGCPVDDTIWSQPVVNADGGWNATTGCEALDYEAYDNFENLMDPICNINWWGMNLFYDGGWIECSNANTFNVRFYEDNAGTPGTLACEYLSVTPTKTAIPNSDVDYGYMVYKYSFDFDPCCELSTGWVSLQNSETDCYFLWVNSPWSKCEYNGDDMSYQWNGSNMVLIDRDQAFCLTTSECLMVNPQVQTAYETGSQFYITWTGDLCAASYNIYEGDNPYADWVAGGNADWTFIANTASTSWNTGASSKKFYLVVGVQ